MCRDHIQELLRSPSTASFPPFRAEGVSIIDEGKGAYQVRGYVDAQNGFGATIRNDFRCHLLHVGAENWRHLSPASITSR